MSTLSHLLENNKRWADNHLQQDADFFKKLAQGQAPKFLWIGCSDSRVPAASIMGLKPGEIFVHRNIANLVVHTDINLLSVLQYSVQVLQVSDIIVCGHYGCGGVQAAMNQQPYGLVDHWLRNIRDVCAKHQETLQPIDDLTKRADKLAELSVMQQVKNTAYTNTVQQAWHNKQKLTIHSWMFDLKIGRLCDLNYSISSQTEIDQAYHLNES